VQELSNALAAVMIGDTTLTALLGTFQGGPSVLTKRPVPEAARRPIALAATTVSDLPADMIGPAVGRMIERDIAVIGGPDHYERVVLAAERIRNLFHRNRFPVAGWGNLMVLARGPIDGPADTPQDIARIVTLQIRLLRFS
jgi:hypothetical protein